MIINKLEENKLRKWHLAYEMWRKMKMKISESGVAGGEENERKYQAAEEKWKPRKAMAAAARWRKLEEGKAASMAEWNRHRQKIS